MNIQGGFFFRSKDAIRDLEINALFGSQQKIIENLWRWQSIATKPVSLIYRLSASKDSSTMLERRRCARTACPAFSGFSGHVSSIVKHQISWFKDPQFEDTHTHTIPDLKRPSQYTIGRVPPIWMMGSWLLEISVLHSQMIVSSSACFLLNPNVWSIPEIHHYSSLFTIQVLRIHYHQYISPCGAMR